MSGIFSGNTIVRRQTATRKKENDLNGARFPCMARSLVKEYARAPAGN